MNTQMLAIFLPPSAGRTDVVGDDATLYCRAPKGLQASLHDVLAPYGIPVSSVPDRDITPDKVVTRQEDGLRSILALVRDRLTQDHGHYPEPENKERIFWPQAVNTHNEPGDFVLSYTAHQHAEDVHSYFDSINRALSFWSHHTDDGQRHTSGRKHDLNCLGPLTSIDSFVQVMRNFGVTDFELTPR